MPLIRSATEADVPAILAIYNDAVAHSTAIWNETLVDLENRRAWLKPDYWYVLVYPAAVNIVFSLAFNLFGDGLRDALDPTTR